MTRHAGRFDVTIAEFVLTWMLMACKQMAALIKHHQAATWPNLPRGYTEGGTTLLRGKTVAIIGLGSIGSAMAEMYSLMGTYTLHSIHGEYQSKSSVCPCFVSILDDRSLPCSYSRYESPRPPSYSNCRPTATTIRRCSVPTDRSPRCPPAGRLCRKLTQREPERPPWALSFWRNRLAAASKACAASCSSSN